MFGPYLLPLEWVVDQPWWVTLLICFAICPGIPQILGVVFVSYWAPWHPHYQFWAYIPGNLYLALFIAAAAVTYDSRFTIPPVLNWLTLIGAFVAWIGLTWMDRKNYTRGQLWSVNKVYHNFLYFWYGYLAVSTYIGAMMSPASDIAKVVITVPGLVWVLCLIADSFLTPREVLKRKWKYAHAENQPIWKNGWRLRRRTAEGYA